MTIKILSPEDQARRVQLLAMNVNTLINAPETSLVTRISVGALANRRALGMWPYAVKIPGAGRIVRYRLGDLLAPPEQADRHIHDSAARQSTINP
jgi:hypothetical protein